MKAMDAAEYAYKNGYERGLEEGKLKSSEDDFIEKYCKGCGSQRCEGPGTPWFDGCSYKWNFPGVDAASEVARLNELVNTLASKIVQLTTKPEGATNYEQFSLMSVHQLAKWLDENGKFDNSPWCTWFNNTYCSKCDVVKISKEESKEKLGFELFDFIDSTECTYCELTKECRFFPGRETPCNKDIIEMWLKERIEDANM